MHRNKTYITGHKLSLVNRAQFGVVILALLAVVSLSIAAATIQTPVTTANGGDGRATGADLAGNGTGLPTNLSEIDVPVFGSLLRGGEATNMTEANATGEVKDQSGGDATGPLATLTRNVPTVLLALLALVLVVGVLAVLRMRGSREEPNETAESEPESETDESAAVEAIGQSAGTAADRLDEPTTTPENAIYRAWYEMIQHLDVASPTTTTPGQFAAAAHDAGMAHDDVAELTAQFETVRYGDAALTDERTDRAANALRRIEDEYADADEDSTEHEDENE